MELRNEHYITMAHPEVNIYNGDIDANRLNYMAGGFANDITCIYLSKLALSSGDILLDVGSGPNTELGDRIIESRARYIALDANPSSIDEQYRHGRDALLANATSIPLKDDAVSIINARFSMSWLSPNDRRDAWAELIRVGTPNIRGVITDYDWGVATGPEAFCDLLYSMQEVLKSMGFDPNYGQANSMYDNVSELLDLTTKTGTYHIAEYRDTIPASTSEDKATVTRLTAESLITSLNAAGQTAPAKVLSGQLAKVLSEDTSSLQLPEITSIVFSSGKPSKSIAYNGARKPISRLHKEHSPRVQKIDRGNDSHLHYHAALALFSRVYKATNYITEAGLESGMLNELTDPHVTRENSEIFIAEDARGEVVSTVRLIHPAELGLHSLPTVAKLIDKYTLSVLPTDVNTHNVGEISAFASEAHDKLVTAELVIALVEAAQKSNIKYLVFGAVEGVPNEIFKQIFGPAIEPVTRGDKNTHVEVRGVGYSESGIDLTVAYLNTENFYQNMIDYYRISTNKHAQYITKLCTKLLSQQGDYA